MIKKDKKLLFKDDRFKWILASADEEVMDGLIEEERKREKFLLEANPDELDILEYIIELENMIKSQTNSINKLTKELSILQNKKWYERVTTV